MAANFKILTHRNSDNLHLNLTGDFDGSSALQLVHMIKKYSKGTCKIFVHTDNLKSIHTFGEAMFQAELSDLNGALGRLYFTGGNAGKLTGDKSSTACSGKMGPGEGRGQEASRGSKG